MTHCPNCGLPVDICNALIYYRSAIQAMHNSEHEKAVFFLIEASRAEQAYHGERLMLAENDNRTLQ